MAVTSSGCYEWVAHHERPNARDLDEAYLVNEIHAIHDPLRYSSAQRPTPEPKKATEY
jgi:hypothetical protein